MNSLNFENFNKLLADGHVSSPEEARTILATAVRQRDRGLFLTVLKICPEVAQTRDEDGYLPLHQTINGVDRIFILFVDMFFPLFTIYPKAAQKPSYGGFYPLHLAAAGGFEAPFFALLSEYPQAAHEPNYKGETPLHLAADAESVSIVLALGNENPKAAIMQDWQGSTPLHRAAKVQSLPIISALLKIDPGAVRMQDYLGETPLHLAVRLRTEYRAGKTIILKKTSRAIAHAMLLADPEAVFVKNNQEHTPIDVASRYHHRTKTLDFLKKVQAFQQLKPILLEYERNDQALTTPLRRFFQHRQMDKNVLSIVAQFLFPTQKPSS